MEDRRNNEMARVFLSLAAVSPNAMRAYAHAVDGMNRDGDVEAPAQMDPDLRDELHVAGLLSRHGTAWTITDYYLFLDHDTEPRRWVYFIRPENDPTVKIGHSRRPGMRISSLQTGNHRRLKIVARLVGGEALEDALHRAFAAERQHGEWFTLSERVQRLLAELVEVGAR